MQAVLAQGGAKPNHERLAEVAGVGSRTIPNVIRAGRTERTILGGHPAQLGPGLGLCLGLSLGAESLRGSLVDANGRGHYELEDDPMPDQLNAAPDVLLPRLRRMAARVLAAAIEDKDLWGSRDRKLRLLGVAVAWPSPIDRAKRPVGRALRDGTWRRREGEGDGPIPLTDRIATEFGDPFFVEKCHALNDVSATALAVAFDACRARAGEPGDERSRIMLVLRIGGGLGSSAVVLAPHKPHRISFIDSQLIEGTNGLAGELGHLPVGRRLIKDISDNSADELARMEYERWRCSCGRLHHLEAFASGAAVVRRLQETGYPINQRGRGHTSWLRSALESKTDPTVVRAVVDVGRMLGRALAGPILMLDPFSIVLTGSLATDPLVEGVRRERDLWANAIRDSVTIEHREGKSGRFLGARGAALAVIRRHVYRNYLDLRGPLPPTFDIGTSEIERLRMPK